MKVTKLSPALVALSAIALAGCTSTIDAMLTQVGAEPGTVSRIEEKAIGYATKPVPVYCNAPLITREEFRGRVNAHPGMDGNMIGIWCAGDPPLTLGE